MAARFSVKCHDGEWILSINNKYYGETSEAVRHGSMSEWG